MTATEPGGLSSASQLNNTTPVNGRVHRNLVTARTLTLWNKGHLWIVLSKSGDDSYGVEAAVDGTNCAFPDLTIRRAKTCYIFSVEFTVRWETSLPGTQDVTKTARDTYRLNWTDHITTQTADNTRFVTLLLAVCQAIAQPPQSSGQPRHPPADTIFDADFNVYSGLSSRRFTSDPRDAHLDGRMGMVPILYAQ
jgi:hypothetical protein